MKAFEYAAPTSVDDAVKLLDGPTRRGALGRHRPDQPDEGLRHQPRAGRLPQGHQGLAGIAGDAGGGLTIGAGTPLADVVEHNGRSARPTRRSGRRRSRSARRRSATWRPSAATCSSGPGAGTSAPATACWA